MLFSFIQKINGTIHKSQNVLVNTKSTKVLKSFHNNKKYPVFTNFLRKIDLLPISKKKPNYLILFLLSNVTAVIFLLSYTPKLINPYQKDIEKVIQNLDSNKTHGHDMISISVLKICGKYIIKPLLIIYKKCLEKGCFPNEWKKANVVPVHKKMTNSY